MPDWQIDFLVVIGRGFSFAVRFFLKQKAFYFFFLF